MKQRQIQIDAANLWQIAHKQIGRIRPVKQLLLQAKQPEKSIQSIFKNIKNNQLKSLLPRGNYTIKQTSKQVPQSVKFLDFYAQKMGFLPMGQIYQNAGNKYIGRIQQVSKKGQKFYKPFPRFDLQTSIQTPNLTQNLSFKATNAIQKWNQFTQAQAQLAQFLQQASSKQGRRNMILQFAKTSSVGTDKLKILSSLYFLYFDQKSSNLNPFKIQNIADLKKVLEQTNMDLAKVYNQAITILSKSNDYDIIDKFHDYKINSIKASLSQQQYEIIKQYLQDQKAYVPKQMVKQTILANEWFQIFNKNLSSATKMVITKWPFGEAWFKPVNYIRK